MATANEYTTALEASVNDNDRSIRLVDQPMIENTDRPMIESEDRSIVFEAQSGRREDRRSVFNRGGQPLALGNIFHPLIIKKASKIICFF
jgi:hypothetical protein